MAKYVISGYIGFDNFGDEAIARTLIEHLKQIGADKITTISGNPSKTKKIYNCEAVKLLNFIKPILHSDILISGGGSLLQDITSLKSLIYYLTVITTALILRKKVYIFAQGITPFRTKIGKFLTTLVLKHCDRISVRDFQSQKLLTSLGINSELIADPVFGATVSKNQTHQDIGIQLRNFEGLNDEFLNKLADEIISSFKDKKIKLFSLQDNIDLPIIDKFAKILIANQCNVEIYKNMSVEETITKLSQLEYLIGMRFHACLIAAKAGVKVLGINYDIKVKTIAENVGFSTISLSGTDIKNGIKSILETNPENYTIPNFKFPNLMP